MLGKEFGSVLSNIPVYYNIFKFMYFLLIKKQSLSTYKNNHFSTYKKNQIFIVYAYILRKVVLDNLKACLRFARYIHTKQDFVFKFCLQF